MGVYNGVATKKYYLLDLTASDYEPDYKQTLVSTVRSVVAEGDSVLEIGSGYGVCTVWLARTVGEEGDVTSYEAGDKQVAATKEAIQLNSNILEEDLTERTAVEHALVGEGNAVYGPSGAKIVNAEELPSCDVLVTDCEGAELDILPAMDVRPRTLVIETHPDFGAGTPELSSLLEDYGYECRKEYVSETPEGPKHILVGDR
ncbi:FkbM family methyltransferase [Halobacterium wangiae]|uniref:FkbM family methyltransferase n=1 Tax=Halobacterium wangiae TaxID=2902623 RepID=UPI001E31AF52|nr:FkbM family methyltransferase [Halobacterium wangiae]